MTSYVATYTAIINSRLVRRQIVVNADTPENAKSAAILELSEDGDPFKLQSVKEWKLDNLKSQPTPNKK